MSRVAKAPVELPNGVEFKQDGNIVTLKGAKGELSMELNSGRAEPGRKHAAFGAAFGIAFFNGDHGHDAIARTAPVRLAESARPRPPPFLITSGTGVTDDPDAADATHW